MNKISPSEWLALFAYSGNQPNIKIIKATDRQYTYYIDVAIPAEPLGHNMTTIGRIRLLDNPHYRGIGIEAAEYYSDLVRFFDTLEEGARWVLAQSLESGLLRRIFNQKFSPLEQLADS